MEATRRTMLCVCSVLCLLTEISCRFIHIPSLVRHGIEGEPLLLSVETQFPLDEANIQGTWTHTNLSGNQTTLVSFTKEHSIVDMMYNSSLVFTRPDVSLFIRQLKQDYEGDFHLSLNIRFHNKIAHVFQEKETIHVTVDVPVSKPVIKKSPSYAVIEDKANVTWTCSVTSGKRVVIQWFRDNVGLAPSERYHFSHDNSTLFISPVKKEDRGTYHCEASNPVSQGRDSRRVELSVYYGPYNLQVNSGQGLRTGEVFTINPGELVFFECQADSNPPISFVWISISPNGTQIITEGPRLEVRTYRLAQTEKYLCRAFNNITQKQDDARFTLVVASIGTGKDKHTQEAASMSSLLPIVFGSLLIIGCMLLVFLRKTCHPRRALINLYDRSFSEQKRPHRSGHEDAKEDFGIYEFVSIPGKTESAQVSCKSLVRLESIQDMHTTIYDVIRHVPDTPSHSLLN